METTWCNPLPGCWRIKFSNDGSNVSDFVITHLENTFTAKNTFAGPVIITGTASFSNSVVFSSNVVIPLNRLMLTGLVSNRVLVSSAGGTQNVAYALTTTTEINQLSGITGNVQSLLNLKANIDSPALTGTPIAPTPAVGTNNTRIATTEFVQLAAASAGVRGYDNRSLILNDAALPGTYYRLSIYNGLLSITPYLIPGADYILFKDVVTGTNYKVSITNGVLHRDVTLLPGMFSYTLLDFPLSSFHRVYIKNGNLNNTPE